jgi:1-aminocyclopropane-1-carboxylate deaminase/D-cysteine desulfhydrase-like pyridoxal-dependent ACC family enzyme
MVEALVASLRSAGRRPYVIDVGGTGATGALGQVLAGREIAGQAAALSISPEAIIVPTATGGTQAGLMVGLALAGVETAVVGVAVAHPAATVWPGVVRLAGELGGLAGLGAGWRPEVRIEDTRPVADYGRHDPAADEATALLARTEGILVDPIYTAKALAWLVAQVRDGVFAGRTVVFWHAGGTPGLFESLEPARAL